MSWFAAYCPKGNYSLAQPNGLGNPGKKILRPEGTRQAASGR